MPGDWGKKDNYTNKDEVIDAVDKKLTQEDIFNRLTNNGASQGMFIEDGNVYFNATYIKSGEINSDLIKTGKISSKDGSVYFDLDNSVVHTTDGQFVTTLDKNSILIKSGDSTLVHLYGETRDYKGNPCWDGSLKINGHTGATFENINSEASLNSYNISFRVKDDDGSEHSTTLSAEGLTTTSISFGVSSDDGAPTQYGSLTCNSSTLVASFSTIQSEANIQLYKRGSSIPAFYVYDGTTNWGGQTLGWDGSKEVATLDANTQAVPFIYGIELVKNAQGYVTDVKLKQHGLRFIGGILV